MPHAPNPLVAITERDALDRQTLSYTCSLLPGAVVACAAALGFLGSQFVPAIRDQTPWLLIAVLGAELWRQSRRSNALIRILKRKNTFEL
ncbi:hypothetical protein [Chitinolyticbacter albus]|uniref:hypothetical protein n=1 Tax=Chitinolyticbacter albus TaxID=2961951 RepID=UPI00210D994F|nr:hypothetical protein [Chitinolyticbacter albus]